MTDPADLDDPSDDRDRLGPPGLIRLMIAVAASAAVLALLAAAGVPAEGGARYGSAGALAISAIILKARDRRDLGSALFAVGCGVAAGWPLVQDACAPVGVVFGPIAGLVARGMSKG